MCSANHQVAKGGDLTFAGVFTDGAGLLVTSLSVMAPTNFAQTY